MLFRSNQSILTAPWYPFNKVHDETVDLVPVPVLGPDLVDVRQLDIIRAEAKKAPATES